MKATSLHLLLVLLSLSSHLLSFNAVPITRTRSLMHGRQLEYYGVSQNTQLAQTEEKSETERIGIRRMDVELNDYPGSGANNRHTPYPRPGKVCADC